MDVLLNQILELPHITPQNYRQKCEKKNLQIIEKDSRILQSNARILLHEETSSFSEMLILQRRTTWFLQEISFPK